MSFKTIASITLALVLSGCSTPRPTPRPLPQTSHPAPCPALSAAPRPLIAFLPGRGMSLPELEAQGFVAAVRRRGVDADLVLVDAHLGYYDERTVFEALREDVVAPALARGVPQVWLAGISLGGYGALLYDERHPGQIHGVVALAPYLGLDEVAAEVARAGGLRAWQPPALDRFTPATSPGDTDRHLWRWLKSQTAAATEGDGRMPIFLGYGDRDRFAESQKLLADALPAERVVAPRGGHDWPAWRVAWDVLLERVPLPRRPACVADRSP